MIIQHEAQKIDLEKLKKVLDTRPNMVVIKVSSFEELEAIVKCTSDPIQADKKYHWEGEVTDRCVKVDPKMDFWIYSSEDYYKGKGYTIVPFKDVCMDSLESLDLDL